jgi:precorrin-3B synthase
LAALVADLPTGLVRATAARGFVFAVADDAHGALVLDRAAAAGLHVSPADAALGVICCIGAAGCWQTDCDTLGRAEALIARPPARLRPGERVHVSGCDKFCASRAPAALTLVGRPGGGFARWTGGVAGPVGDGG